MKIHSRSCWIEGVLIKVKTMTKHLQYAFLLLAIIVCSPAYGLTKKELKQELESRYQVTKRSLAGKVKKVGTVMVVRSDALQISRLKLRMTPQKIRADINGSSDVFSDDINARSLRIGDRIHIYFIKVDDNSVRFQVATESAHEVVHMNVRGNQVLQSVLQFDLPKSVSDLTIDEVIEVIERHLLPEHRVTEAPEVASAMNSLRGQPIPMRQEVVAMNDKQQVGTQPTPPPQAVLSSAGTRTNPAAPNSAEKSLGREDCSAVVDASESVHCLIEALSATCGSNPMVVRLLHSNFQGFAALKMTEVENFGFTLQEIALKPVDRKNGYSYKGWLVFDEDTFYRTRFRHSKRGPWNEWSQWQEMTNGDPESKNGHLLFIKDGELGYQAIGLGSYATSSKIPEYVLAMFGKRLVETPTMDYCVN